MDLDTRDRWLATRPPDRPAPALGTWLDPFRWVFDDDWPWRGLLRLPHVRVDVSETADEVVVRADIPGLESREDLRVTLDGRQLEIAGTTGRSEERREGDVHRVERYVGRFARTVRLPADVREEGARATYRNGVLEIRLPKAARASGRSIDVDFG